eukprot:251555-Prymnesium_polylepis.2
MVLGRPLEGVPLRRRPQVPEPWRANEAREDQATRVPVDRLGRAWRRHEAPVDAFVPGRRWQSRSRAYSAAEGAKQGAWHSIQHILHRMRKALVKQSALRERREAHPLW